MKKTVALMLVCIMMITLPISVLADSDSIACETTLLPIADYTASEWFESSSKRCMFAVVSLADLAIFFDAEDFDRISEVMSYALASDAVYVAKQSIGLYACYIGENETLLVNYVPLNDKLSITYMEGDFDVSARKIALKSAFQDAGCSIYSVDAEEYIELLQSLNEIISE